MGCGCKKKTQTTETTQQTPQQIQTEQAQSNPVVVKVEEVKNS